MQTLKLEVKKLEIDIAGAKEHLAFPTVKQLELFGEELTKDPGKEVAAYKKFLMTLGMSEGSFDKLTMEHLILIANTLNGQNDQKKS